MADVAADVSARETVRLIGSDKVEGTVVRRSNGDKIGTIERVMIDKRSGRVAYAVMSFGGFLGIGDEYRALPWNVLKYNEDLDAYELNVTEDQLRGAPTPARGWEVGAVDRGWERNIHDYYGVSRYW
jgi:hypothetical protein